MVSASVSRGRLQRAGCALLLFGMASPALARGLLVSPTQLGLIGKAGQTASGILYVSSSKEEKNHITVAVSDFVRDEDNKIVEKTGKTHARSCKAWLDVDRTDFVSPEWGRIEVTITAHIPPDANGSYWALIGLQSEPPPRDPKLGTLMFRVVPRVAIPVVVTVEGSAKPQIRIAETHAERTADGVDLYSIVENSGNTAVLVSGAFSLERATTAGGGEELASTSVGPLTSLPGSRLKAKAHLAFSGSLVGVQAHAYLRYGSRPEDTAEAAVVIP